VLLGQTVNSYNDGTHDFADLLRRVGSVPGIRRVRFTSPHPNDFSDRVIDAMARVNAVCEHVHLPMQSGSTSMLKRMLRRYTRDDYFACVERLRSAIPGLAVTTDIIVGFPGESEQDFQATLDVVERARFASAYTFQYSKRPGTPAAVLDEQVPRVVVQDRYERLVALVNDIAWAENKRLVGRPVELMVSEGEGRKDGQTHRLSGRGPDNRLVHFTPMGSRGELVDVRPGDIVEVRVSYAAPHHLVADGPVLDVRRTRSGDAWERRTTAPSRAVALGLPTIGAPGAPVAQPVHTGACSVR
jgi:tRNA-2-methylthio-N6-dimethylallyladenosine synthase